MAALAVVIAYTGGTTVVARRTTGVTNAAYDGIIVETFVLSNQMDAVCDFHSRVGNW
jgi:hypothetical protein